MNLVITIIIIGAYAMQGAEAVFLLPVLRELGLTWNPYDYEGNLIHQARHEDRTKAEQWTLSEKKWPRHTFS